MELIIWLIGIAAFVYSIIIHEIAHGWVADRLGDPTARLSKRLTLNPLPHIDLYGSILVPLFLIISRFPFLFGWAKPVPIDPFNLKNPKKDSAAIALAGPLSNIAIATVLAIIHTFVVDQTVSGLLRSIIIINVSLAVFNLMPIGPLDGAKILIGILPVREANALEIFMERYGLVLLMISIFPILGGYSLISFVTYPVINIILHLLIPGFSRI